MTDISQAVSAVRQLIATLTGKRASWPLAEHIAAIRQTRADCPAVAHALYLSAAACREVFAGVAWDGVTHEQASNRAMLGERFITCTCGHVAQGGRYDRIAYANFEYHQRETS